MKKRRVAIVGLGMALKPYLASFAELSDRAEIAACYRRGAEARKAFAALHPYRVVDDIDAIMNDASIDAVMILTPPNTHLELIERAAASGKHVLVEKPIDGTLARAERAVAAMERAGRTFAVMLQHRFREASLKLAAIAHSGELGALVSGSASIRWWRSPEYFAQEGRGLKARDGGGVLLTQAIHTLDLFQSLTGPIARVAAYARTSPLRKIDTEDIVGAAVEFANGAIGTIDATTVAYPGFPERIELACAHATAVLAAESLDISFKDGRHVRHEGAPSKSGGADPMAFSHDAHKASIVDFLDSIDERREPRVSGREALKVLALIDALLRSSAEQRSVALAA
jgi:UDP-N-acetyl-2-amino-2-deoxyglucuronate dehydrogenase